MNKPQTKASPAVSPHFRFRWRPFVAWSVGTCVFFAAMIWFFISGVDDGITDSAGLDEVGTLQPLKQDTGTDGLFGPPTEPNPIGEIVGKTTTPLQVTPSQPERIPPSLETPTGDSDVIASHNPPGDGRPAWLLGTIEPIPDTSSTRANTDHAIRIQPKPAKTNWRGPRIIPR